jgi:hypothetical protein
MFSIFGSFQSSMLRTFKKGTQQQQQEEHDDTATLHSGNARCANQTCHALGEQSCWMDRHDGETTSTIKDNHSSPLSPKSVMPSYFACLSPLATSSTTSCNDPDETQQYDYVSYISPKTIVTETVYHFIRGCIYGTAYAFVTPFFMPGSPGALLEQKTGVFKPAPVFSTLPWSIPSHALFIGSILACQRFGCKSMEYVRAKSDPWNDTFGYFLVVPHYQICLTKHAVWHNRLVGGAILGCLVLANWP